LDRDHDAVIGPVEWAPAILAPSDWPSDRCAWHRRRQGAANGETAGAFAGLGMSLNGILTAILLPLGANLF
jgi:hypothetical protein